MGTRKALSENNGKKLASSTLKRGWTTGACATAACKSALRALLTGEFEDPVQITLPKGDAPSFALLREELTDQYASATIIKDAGDDPDVTHGAKITAKISKSTAGLGIIFKAGSGVGIVTKPGLPLEVGEPAINPVPRELMTNEIEKLCRSNSFPTDIIVEISVENGEEIAAKTWNGRLGIVGGLSILGTTGVVHPFSCSAWIHSIYRGVDVARAQNLPHILAATGSTSEKAALALYDLPLHATIDMGDFAGGLLKYLRTHQVPKLSIAGGFAKLTKLAQGEMDLHSSRSQVDFEFLANCDALKDIDPNTILNANTALEVLQIAQKAGTAEQLCAQIAKAAQIAAKAIAKSQNLDIEIIIVSRDGAILARADFVN